MTGEYTVPIGGMVTCEKNFNVVYDREIKRYNIANKVYSIVFTAAQKNKCVKYC